MNWVFCGCRVFPRLSNQRSIALKAIQPNFRLRNETHGHSYTGTLINSGYIGGNINKGLSGGGGGGAVTREGGSFNDFN